MALSGAEINKIRSKEAKFATRKNIFLKKLIEDKKNFDLKSVPKKLQTNNNLDTIWLLKDIDYWTKDFCIEYFGLAQFSLSSESVEKFELAEEIAIPELELCIDQFLSAKEVEEFLTQRCS